MQFAMYNVNGVETQKTVTRYTCVTGCGLNVSIVDCISHTDNDQEEVRFAVLLAAVEKHGSGMGLGFERRIPVHTTTMRVCCAAISTFPSE